MQVSVHVDSSPDLPPRPQQLTVIYTVDAWGTYSLVAEPSLSQSKASPNSRKASRECSMNHVTSQLFNNCISMCVSAQRELRRLLGSTVTCEQYHCTLYMGLYGLASAIFTSALDLASAPTKIDTPQSPQHIRNIITHTHSLFSNRKHRSTQFCLRWKQMQDNSQFYTRALQQRLGRRWKGNTLLLRLSNI